MGKTSPVVGWLRALAKDLHGRVGGKGIGAVGMCFSGGFALGMMVDDVMVAPVLSQPSLPFAAGRGAAAAARGADLNLSPDDALMVAHLGASALAATTITPTPAPDLVVATVTVPAAATTA